MWDDKTKMKPKEEKKKYILPVQGKEQKRVTIPKESPIEHDDYVEVKKVE